MPSYSNTRKWSAGTLLVLLASSPAWAQRTDADVSETSPPPAVGELLSARVRYGVVLRSGRSSDTGRGLTYDGMTPNDVALSFSYFGRGYVGGALWLQREAFSLLDDSGGKVTSGGLLRAAVGPSGRVAFGPFKIEALVGYAFQQLPLFGSTNQPELRPAQRHSLMLASRATLSLPAGFGLEARGELPISLSTRDNTGAAATSSSGFAVGGGLSKSLFNVDKALFSAVLDYQYVSDSVTSAAGEAASQSLSRMGLSVEVALLDRLPAPKVELGGLEISVVDEATGQALEGAVLSLSREGQAEEVGTRGGGQFSGSSLTPGPYTAKATAPGYLPGEATVAVVGGRQEQLSVALKKEPPKKGALTIAITDKESGTAIAGASVRLAGEEYLTNAAGEVRLVELTPGTVEIEIAAKDFVSTKEVGTVVAGRSASVPVALNKAAKPIPATITGLVRSTRGGRPISAELEIPEAKIRTRASGAGSFSIRLPGGTYRVIISADGYMTQNKTVTVKDNTETIFNVDLYPDGR